MKFNQLVSEMVCLSVAYKKQTTKTTNLDYKSKMNLFKNFKIAYTKLTTILMYKQHMYN